MNPELPWPLCRFALYFLDWETLSFKDDTSFVLSTVMDRKVFN